MALKRYTQLTRRTALKTKTPLKTGSALKRTSIRVKPSPIRGQKRRTFAAASRFVRARDPWCVTCLMEGKRTPSTEAGHFKHTSDKANAQLGGNLVWYDLRNLNGQCSTCNRHNSGELDLYALYLEQKHGHGIIQELDRLYRTPKKWTMEELKEKERQFTDAFNALALKGLGVIREEPLAA